MINDISSQWAKNIWWTYRRSCWPTQLDFFGRLYFGP